MKKLLKLLLITLVLSACNDTNNGLTKALALKNIKACDAERPIEIVKGIYVGKMTYHNTGSSLTELNYLKRLAKKEVITLDSISSSKQKMSNHTRINTVYDVAINPKHKQYITKQNNNIAYVRLVYRDVQEISIITLNNEVRADVIASFKKVKTPFYDTEFDKSFLLKDKPDEFLETISFNKSSKNGWTSCFLKKNKS